jgi:hypothetical protein
LREFRVGPLVPPELDADQPGPLETVERAQWLGLAARELAALGRNGEAVEAARAALELDPDCDLARETLRRSE